MRVGQGPTVLAVGAGRGCLDIFLSSIISLFFLPLSGGDGPILKDIKEKKRKIKINSNFIITACKWCEL